MHQPLNSSPSLSSYCNQPRFPETDVKISKDFLEKLKLSQESPKEKVLVDQNQRKQQENKSEEENEVNGDEDFSFACFGADSSPISAEEAFHDGQIRSVFPLFNRDLLFSDDGSESLNSRLPHRPPVKKVFVERNDHDPLPLSGSDNIDEIASGPYCSWNKNAVEASPESCKKSNSTGFSKMWRFRDFLGRSHSDGRDAFVFLNNSTTTSAKREEKKQEKVVEKSEGSSEKKTAGDGKVKVNVTGGKVKTKKGVKSETASLSAHELYTRNRSKEDDRRRSYLPYRPELVGFFTNVNGGMSRNVHPF